MPGIPGPPSGIAMRDLSVGHDGYGQHAHILQWGNWRFEGSCSFSSISPVYLLLYTLRFDDATPRAERKPCGDIPRFHFSESEWSRKNKEAGTGILEAIYKSLYVQRESRHRVYLTYLLPDLEASKYNIRSSRRIRGFPSVQPIARSQSARLRIAEIPA